jgi:threonine/homoserine/homoserine lactone efflux protein
VPNLPQIVLQGVVIGFSVAAPVGPIGLLCIHRTLAKGRSSGLASGLGAATADAFYGGVAGFGVTFVSAFLVSQQAWIHLVGGSFLLFLGARIFLAIPKDPGPSTESRGLPHDYLSTLALTLTNPVTIVAFAAIFSGLGMTGSGGDYGPATALLSGVFCGSALWWTILSAGVGSLRGALNPSRMRRMNEISGAVIACFGAITFLTLVV